MRQSRTIRPALAHEAKPLLNLWLRSVRSTHAFLNEDDIAFYTPVVKNLLERSGDVWVITEDESSDDGNAPMGFIIFSGESVEALFIDPAHHGKGLGKTLIAHGIHLKGQLTVDVNEQNPDGHAFYTRCGFKEVRRSPLDPMGKPFPIIHMLLAEKP